MGKKNKEVEEETPKKKKAKDEPTKADLLEQLAEAEDQGEKRKIRAKLRSMGHTGGLGGRGKKKKSKDDDDEKPSKKSKKAKAKDDDDEDEEEEDDDDDDE